MASQGGSGDSGGASGRRRRFSFIRRIARHFQRTMVAGILVMLPIGITALVLKFIFDLLTPILQPVTDLLPGPDIHGTGLIALLLLIYIVGLVAAFVIGRRLIDLAHRAMEVIPFVKGIYSTARTAIQLLGGNLEANDRDKYTGVVLIEFPRPGIHSIGLITSRMDNPDGGEFLSIYIPTTPIPSSGFLVIVPDTEVITTDISVEEAMSVVVSGGILTRSVFERVRSDETELGGNGTYSDYRNRGQ